MPTTIDVPEGDTVTLDIGGQNPPNPSKSNPLELTETALAIANIKSVAEQPAMLCNLMFGNLVNNTNLSQQNALANQQAMNEVGRAVTGKVVNTILNLGPLEAMSALQILTGQEVAEQKLDLEAANSLS